MAETGVELLSVRDKNLAMGISSLKNPPHICPVFVVAVKLTKGPPPADWVPPVVSAEDKKAALVAEGWSPKL